MDCLDELIRDLRVNALLDNVALDTGEPAPDMVWSNVVRLSPEEQNAYGDHLKRKFGTPRNWKIDGNRFE